MGGGRPPHKEYLSGPYGSREWCILLSRVATPTTKLTYVVDYYWIAHCIPTQRVTTSAGLGRTAVWGAVQAPSTLTGPDPHCPSVCPASRSRLFSARVLRTARIGCVPLGRARIPPAADSGPAETSPWWRRVTRAWVFPPLDHTKLSKAPRVDVVHGGITGPIRLSSLPPINGEFWLGAPRKCTRTGSPLPSPSLRPSVHCCCYGCSDRQLRIEQGIPPLSSFFLLFSVPKPQKLLFPSALPLSYRPSISLLRGNMPEHSEHVAENILNNIMETFSDSVPKQKSVRFFEEENAVSAGMNRLFGRQKSVHMIFGGGKSADVLLWRNKKISSSVLAGATAIWVLFEWLNYHFLTLVCLALVVGMLIQFVWSNASGLVNRTPSQVPRVVLPDELFVNIGMAIGTEINRFLGFLQDVSSGRNLKQFLMVVAGLWAAAIIGSWCNFLTVLYIGFVSAHILPVLYERYEDQVDDFVYSVLGQVQQHYRKLDEGLLSKIPKGNLRAKKSE